MAFVDPQSVTINAVAISLPRMGTSNPATNGEFRSADGNVTMNIRQYQSAQRYRREIRLTQRKVAADPISAVNKEQSASVFIVVDEPKWGFSDTELTNLIGALTTYFAAIQQGRLLAGEC